MAALLAVGKYWPAVVAALYLAYVAAAGQAGSVPGAMAALLAALGLNAGIVAAHAKIDKL